MPYLSFSENKSLNINNEHDLQKSVVEYLRKTDILFASNCNGFLDTPNKRILAFEEGMQNGHPDLIIYTPNKQYNGMAIELKSPLGVGKLQKNQSEWLQKLEVECKYFCICSNDYTIIIECILKYILSIL